MLLLSTIISILIVKISLAQEVVQVSADDTILNKFTNASREVTLGSIIFDHDDPKPYIDGVFAWIVTSKSKLKTATFTATEMINFISTVEEQVEVTAAKQASSNNVTELAFHAPPIRKSSDEMLEKAAIEVVAKMSGSEDAAMAEVDRDKFRTYVNSTILGQKFTQYPEMCSEMSLLFDACKAMVKREVKQVANATERSDLKYVRRKYSSMAFKNMKRIRSVQKACNNGFSALEGYRMETCTLSVHPRVIGRSPDLEQCFGMFECYMTPDELKRVGNSTLHSEALETLDNDLDKKVEEKGLTPLQIANRSIIIAILNNFLTQKKVWNIVGPLAAGIFLTLFWITGAALLIPAYGAGTSVYLHAILAGGALNLGLPRFDRGLSVPQ